MEAYKMATNEHYKVAHWTVATAEANYKNQSPTEITVNDRAATRQAIINRVRQNGMKFVERSEWGAHKNKPANMANDWNYHSIAIHHAGRSASCGNASHQLQEIQDEQMSENKKFADIGYHYAIDCLGSVYEGRDIRFKGEHLYKFNTAVIGIVLLENLTEPEEGGDAVAKIRSFLNSIGINQHPQVPESQKISAEKLIKVLREFFKIAALGGHKEFPNQMKEGRICPGKVGITFVKKLRSTLAIAAP
jgi:hypothetical protein